MAEIVLGAATTHGPLLSTPPEHWDGRAKVDRNNPELAFKDGTYNFEELYDLRKDKYFEKQNSLEVRTAHFDRCQKGIAALGEKLEEVNPDIVVIVGDDQHEWFQDEIQPSYAIYCADEVMNYAVAPDRMKFLEERGLSYSSLANHPPEDQKLTVPGALGTHMIEQAIVDEFDVAYCGEQPKGPDGPRNVGHAYGFVSRRLLHDRDVPMVPILINTYYPPNQPTPKRCYEFGQSLGRAIKSWESDAKVAVVASGGMTHFVVDEEFDDKMITAMKKRDTDTIFNEPNIMFRSGTSEIKNWIVTAGMIAETDFEMDVLDYVPCYRSEAGTGSGMAFATWD